MARNLAAELKCCEWWFVPANEVHWREEFEDALRELLATDARIVAFNDSAECKAMDRQVRRRLTSIRDAMSGKWEKVNQLLQDHNVLTLRKRCREEAVADPDLELVDRWVQGYSKWLQDKHARLRKEQVAIDRDLSDADSTLARLTSERHVTAERFAHLANVPAGATARADDDTARLSELQARGRNRALEELRGSIVTLDMDDEIRNLMSLKSQVHEATRTSEDTRQKRESFDQSLRERRDMVNGSSKRLREAERQWDEARSMASDRAKQYFENEKRIADLRQLEQWNADLLGLDRQIGEVTTDVADWTQYKETITWEIPPYEQPFTEATRAIDLVEFARVLRCNLNRPEK
tara:strand:+ start:45 stop:1097 length:1053 start_codon:yes stop_codon:yes gene_type:complete